MEYIMAMIMTVYLKPDTPIDFTLPAHREAFVESMKRNTSGMNVTKVRVSDDKTITITVEPTVIEDATEPEWQEE